jgi:hypothetical protein
MLTKPSGLKSVQASDNAALANFNRNDDLLDFLLRPYREKVDLATWDDAAKKYTKVEYLRPEDSSVAITAVLSNKDAGTQNFLTDTWTMNTPAGVKTRIWTLVYDASGNVVDKTYADS